MTPTHTTACVVLTVRPLPANQGSLFMIDSDHLSMTITMTTVLIVILMLRPCPAIVSTADLIMLGLATHEPNFTIIREEFKPNKPRPCAMCGQLGHEMKDCQGTARQKQGEVAGC